ncbi:hypothetical protein M3Y99_01377400 [Aphelenchoides fujianensis]|nr:hypothetical protein M3Y99_01377400 [Aphelenchoides fujianensis]
MSMSERVGVELGDRELSSFQIRFEGNRTERTRVLFMTDGVLLKELQTDVKLSRFSVIVIDEAHERSMYSDVLIGLLSRICVQRAKAGVPLKLVIMSATLRLSDFMQQRLFPTTMPKLLSVESRQFPVTVHFERRTPDDHMRAAFLKVCKIHERLPEGGILVFVSGQKEEREDDEQDEQEAVEKIDLVELEQDEQLLDLDDRDGADCADEAEDEAADEFELRDERPAGGQQRPLFCLPLYSMLPSALQRRVFEPVPAGRRLCVVATNVAETSLTIPGVRYVVDAGKEKRRDFDPVTGVSQFNVAWISKASVAQRSGRAGRVAAGHAYRLYSSAVFEDFAAFPPPEILHKLVDQVVLHLKSMNIRKIANFPFPTPPAADQVQKAEERLVRLRALAKKKDDDAAGITPLGRTLLVFPLAPHFAKILVLGAQNGVLLLVAKLVAALSVREPLVNVAALEGATDAETQGLMAMLLKQRRRWTRAGQPKRLGDLQVLLAVVREADEKRAADRAAATTCGLRFEALREIRKMRAQLLRLVGATGGLKRLAGQNGSSTTADLADARWTDADLGKIRQIFAACQPDQIARRAPAGELVPKGAYRTPLLEEFVFIDPVSALYKEEPEFVLYQDLVQLADRELLQNVAEVEVEWLRSGLFLERLDERGRERAARVAVELKTLYALNERVPERLDSRHWQVLVGKSLHIAEREEFLRQLHACEQNARRVLEKNERRQASIAEQKRRAARGEVVYGRGFQERLSLRGPDFRRLLDARHGARLWAAERLVGGVPEVRVDCRHLRLLPHVWLRRAMNEFQRLHEENWTAERPLPLRFHAFLPNDEVAFVAKQSLLCLSGRRARRGRKGVLEELPAGMDRTEVAYVSTLGNRLLNAEALGRAKVFVLHAFPEHLLGAQEARGLRQWMMREEVPAFRLPLDSELKWIRGHRSQWPAVNAAVLRDALATGGPWRDVLRRHIPRGHFEEAAEPPAVHSSVEEVVDHAWSAEPPRPRAARGPKEKRVYTHRYSREERNRRRREEAAG